MRSYDQICSLLFILISLIIVTNTETMIQKTGGHDGLPSALMFG